MNLERIIFVMIDQLSFCTYSSLVSCPHDAMAKVLDYDIEVSKFKLQSHYYVHFLTEFLVKGMNIIIPPPIG